MAADPSIYGLIRQPETPNLLAQFGQFQQVQGMADQNRLAQLAFQDRERQQADQVRLRGIYGQGLQGEGLENALLKGGFASESLKFGADRRANAKTDADTQATQIATAVKRTEAIGQGLGYLKDNPSLENAQSLVAGWVQSGLMTPEIAQQKMADFQRDPTPQGIQRLALQGYQGALSAKDQLAKYDTRNLGGTTQTTATNPVTGEVRVVNSVQNTVSPDALLSQQTQIRGQNMNDARARETIGLTREAQDNVYDAERGVLVNRRTGLARPAATMDGAPIGGKKPTESQQRVTDANEVLTLLDQADPLIREATNSYAGAGYDKAARFFGKSTEGAQAGAQLKALEGALVAKMPKMSGPQSDKDVQLYQQMAGQIGDPTLPAETKLAAIKTIREINQRAAGGGAQARSAAPRISTDADYDALPSGSTFVGPDGKTRRKP